MEALEYKHQQAVIKWSQQPSVRRKWPELSMLHHVKNETKEGQRQVAIDKAMGVKKGVPDLCLPVPRGGYHGLYVELKKPGGKLSKPQEWWITHLCEQGYMADVCHGYQEAIEVIARYMSL